MKLTDEQTRALVKTMTGYGGYLSREKLQRIRSRLEAIGFVIVPIEPTEAMVDAWANTQDASAFGDWEAMSQAGRVM